MAFLKRVKLKNQNIGFSYFYPCLNTSSSILILYGRFFSCRYYEKAEEEIVADTGEEIIPETFSKVMEEVTNITQIETVTQTVQEQATSSLTWLPPPVYGYFSLLLEKNSTPTLYDVFLPTSRQKLDPMQAGVKGNGINNTSDWIKVYDSGPQEETWDANLAGSSEIGIIKSDVDEDLQNNNK